MNSGGSEEVGNDQPILVLYLEGLHGTDTFAYIPRIRVYMKTSDEDCNFRCLLKTTTSFDISTLLQRDMSRPFLEAPRSSETTIAQPEP